MSTIGILEELKCHNAKCHDHKHYDDIEQLYERVVNELFVCSSSYNKPTCKQIRNRAEISKYKS